MNRRQFLNTSLWATGAFCAGWSLTACQDDASEAESAGGALPAIGLQLYTIRSVMTDEVRGALERVADIGYDEVELAGYYGRSPEEIGTLLQDLGLAAPATHISLQRIREAPGEVVETAQALGHDYVVCPWLPEEQRSPLDSYRRLAEDLSAFGQRCSDAGLQFAYHNHDFEFEKVGGTRPYDLLLAETDPEHVKMEIDLYWVVEAGHDPIDYITEAPARYPLCHVKDRGPDGGMVSVGEGTIDFADIFREGQFEHYFVEHDNPEAPMTSIETSYQTLDQMEL